jgi:chaperone required for assembly of F1-ATPase
VGDERATRAQDSAESKANGRAARKRTESLPKCFYKDVAVKAEGAGAALLLDGKTVRTPAKKPLVLPSRALAEAVADEWRAQGERIDPTTMPLTKLANSAIDGVAGREQAVIDDIMNHAASDLLCYRAPGPRGLVEAQAKHWDTVLAWAKEALGAPLVLGEGVVHVAQPQASLDRLRQALAGRDPFSLAALHVMTALTGSALLALAAALGRLTPEEAWRAAHVDEDWQVSQWGEDQEAAERRANRRRDFTAAARTLRLLNPSP